MIDNKIICDDCKRDITQFSYGVWEHRLTLSVESLRNSRSKWPIDYEHHFCSVKCLGLWCQKKESE